MKILKSTLSIISIITITIIFVILSPSFWKNRIEDQLNKQLSQRGDWEVKFHKLNGHLLFNVSIDSLYLSNPNSSNVSISKVDMKLNFFKSLFAYPSLKYLKLTELHKKRKKCVRQLPRQNCPDPCSRFFRNQNVQKIFELGHLDLAKSYCLAGRNSRYFPLLAAKCFPIWAQSY